VAQPALLLFAKQPIAGEVKTRLLPQYSAAQAAEIAALLIEETVALAAANWPGPIYLSCTPDVGHPLFRDLAARFGVMLTAQTTGDLGARLQQALGFGIERHGAAAVLGCDVPHCEWEILDDANSALARGRNVLGPSEDGGYYLIGLCDRYPELFVDIDWGGPRVLAATLERAQAIGIEFTLLPMLRDIDTAADLWLVAKQYPVLRRFL
jgi:uncharacterized protein